jgi:hypothetical protein
MGEYYQQMADRFPSEKMFWLEAIGDEVDHARRIGRLIADVSAKPAKYSSGKYRVQLMETFLTGIYEQIEMIINKEMSPAQMLKTVMDYESSVLMSRPFDVVESNDSGFRDFKETFAQDIKVHSDRIRQYIRGKFSLPNKVTQTA